MYELLPSYYIALQVDHDSLDRRAAKKWTASAGVIAGDRRLNLKSIAIAIAIAIAGLGGTTAVLAHDLPGLPDGVIAEQTGEDGPVTMPPHPFDGRPW